MPAIWRRAPSIAALLTSASQAVTATSSIRCSKPNTAATSTTPARAGMQGFLVLADAINRAGSTEPEKIQAALKATDLKPDQLMICYNGVKFHETAQNTLAATFLIQLQGKQYVSIWPENLATASVCSAAASTAAVKPTDCGRLSSRIA